MTSQKLNWDRVLPIFALTFVDILGLTIILPLLHLYAVAYGATPAQIGLTLAVFPLAQLIGVPVMGALSDRFGRKPMLLISQVTTCISFIMLGAATSLEMVILSRLVDGLFGANLATAQAALSDITTDENRAQGLGLTGAAFGLGFLFGPVISLISLEFTDDLSMPAYISAVYSFISILLTLFLFKETLPLSRRVKSLNFSFKIPSIVTTPRILILLVLMFFQQFIFFGFESLLGLFTLGRLGMMGQGNAALFLFVGIILLMTQLRLIGKWTRKYGERRLVPLALGLISVGLILFSLTPEQPHPFYVRTIVANRIAEQADTSVESVIGDIQVPLPPDGQNGIGGVIWLFLVIIPIGIGSGLIRPSINSLLTKTVGQGAYGSVMGYSAAAVSAADALAPIAGGLIFQHYGVTSPFLLGGLVMGVLMVVSLRALRPSSQPQNA